MKLPNHVGLKVKLLAHCKDYWAVDWALEKWTMPQRQGHLDWMKGVRVTWTNHVGLKVKLLAHGKGYWAADYALGTWTRPRR